MNYKVGWSSDNGLAVLEYGNNKASFGSISAILSHAEELPGMPVEIKHKLLGLEGGFRHLTDRLGGVVIGNVDGVREVAGATEAEAWELAAEASLERHESDLVMRKGEAAQFVVGYWRSGSVREAMVGVAPPINGEMRGVDGRGYTGIASFEPLDAEKHRELSAIVRHGLYRLVRDNGHQNGPLSALSQEQRCALLEFREKHGAQWKSKLQNGWLKAAFPGPLQQLRNQFGPEWLQGLKPADFDVLKPSVEEVFTALVKMGQDASFAQAEQVLARMSDQDRVVVMAAAADRDAPKGKLEAIRTVIEVGKLLEERPPIVRELEGVKRDAVSPAVFFDPQRFQNDNDVCPG